MVRSPGRAAVSRPWPVVRDPLFGCALWTGLLDRDGYAIAERGRRAHLIAFRATGRDHPPGNVVDHTCRRRNCVEPAHLESVTRGVNELRKLWRVRCRVAVCPVGHRIEEPAVTPEGGRVCRRCLERLRLTPVDVAPASPPRSRRRA